MKYLRHLKLQFIKGEFKNPIKGQVREPGQIFDVFKNMKDWTKETLIGVYLSDELEMNSYSVLSVGSDSEATVAPDEIFGNAILTRSPYFILLHNHPSGHTEPSREDRELMHILKAQSDIMNRVLLDFMIVSEDGYWSMFEEEEGGEYPLG